jgi:ATPase family associated with various cellular activities (AAA)
MKATLLLVALSGASAFSTCPPLSRRHTPGPLCSCPSGDIPPGQEQPKSFADSRKQAAGSSAAPKASPAAPPTKWGHTDRIDVHPESWALGNGNFADSYLQSQARIGARAIAGESPMAVGRALVMSRTEQDRRQEAEDRQLRQAASTAKRSSSSSSSTPAANTRTAAAAAAAATPLQQPQPAAASSAAATTAQSQTTASSSSKPATAARTVVLDSETLGVGGMDHVVDAIRRRVWIPLSAPRSLLDDLGVSPVSGLLLHGPPGCGKSLLARRLSALLTPRAPTFVSGPEILDRFVGSSEANVRSLFDYPPPLPAGVAVNDDEALHVIVLDEFDAIAGHRSAG